MPAEQRSRRRLLGEEAIRRVFLTAVLVGILTVWPLTQLGTAAGTDLPGTGARAGQPQPPKTPPPPPPVAPQRTPPSALPTPANVDGLGPGKTPPKGRPPEKIKPPKDKAQPKHSGMVDRPHSFADGLIKVSIAPGRTIAEVLAKYPQFLSATQANRPPFTPGEIAVGLDRTYVVNVAPGFEKQLVKTLADRLSDFDGMYMIWTPPGHATVAPSDYTAGQNHLDWINITDAWSRTISNYVDPGAVKIAIRDSGLKGDHPDLSVGCSNPGASNPCGKLQCAERHRLGSLTEPKRSPSTHATTGLVTGHHIEGLTSGVVGHSRGAT